MSVARRATETATRAGPGSVAGPVRLAVGVAIPVAAYVTLSQTLHDDLAALAIAEAIPIAWLLAAGARNRRVDPIVLATAAVLAIAVAVSLASSGSTLPLKLRRSVITGSLGLACIGSILLGRPLLPSGLERITRGWPGGARIARALRGHSSPHQSTVLTGIIGVTLLADAVAQATLAIGVTTAVFLGASRIARTCIFALGLGACGLYMRRHSPSIPGEQDGAFATSAAGDELGRVD